MALVRSHFQRDFCSRSWSAFGMQRKEPGTPCEVPGRRHRSKRRNVEKSADQLEPDAVPVCPASTLSGPPSAFPVSAKIAALGFHYVWTVANSNRLRVSCCFLSRARLVAIGLMIGGLDAVDCSRLNQGERHGCSVRLAVGPLLQEGRGRSV